MPTQARKAGLRKHVLFHKDIRRCLKESAADYANPR